MIISEAKRLNTVSEYYFSGKLKEIQALRQQGMDIINLGIGSPDLSPDNKVIATLERYARNAGSHGYQSYNGIVELREAISAYLNDKFTTYFDPMTEILPLMGSKEGILHISMAFLDPGDKVLVPNPGYPTYASASSLAGAEVVYYNLDEKKNWSIDMASLKMLPLDEIKIMWVNYPNMPTGEYGSLGQFKELVRLAEKHRFLLVNDNPYSMIFPEKPLSIFQVEGAREVALELNSMSKSHNMAGWRLGWVSGEMSYLRMILRVKSNMDSGMFLPLQRAAIKALQSPEEWYSKNLSTYQKRRETANHIMDVLECTYNQQQGGMFVWGKAPDEISNVEKWIDHILEKAEVFITPGFIFGSLGARHVRISLCASDHLLQEALSRIERKKSILLGK